VSTINSNPLKNVNVNVNDEIGGESNSNSSSSAQASKKPSEVNHQVVPSNSLRPSRTKTAVPHSPAASQSPPVVKAPLHESEEMLLRSVEAGIRRCDEILRDSNIQGVIHGRVKKNLKNANAVVQCTKPYVDRAILPVLVPVGANNSGKSYFVNNLSLCDELGDLESATSLKDEEKKYWANHFPIKSSSMSTKEGKEALTILCTRVSSNYAEQGLTKTFVAKLVFTNESTYNRRASLLRDGGESPEVTVPPFQELKDRVTAALEKTLPDIDPGDCTDPVEIKRVSSPTLNIFDELCSMRKIIKQFEVAVTQDSTLSWIVDLHIEGPFKNLHKLKIIVMDVKRIYFLLHFTEAPMFCFNFVFGFVFFCFF
jgi:hypothetical protein